MAAVSINAALNNITTTTADVWDLDTSKKETPDANNPYLYRTETPAVVRGRRRRSQTCGSDTPSAGRRLGPVVAAPVGAVVVPAVVRGIKLVQPEGVFDRDAALRRALLANSALLVAEQENDIVFVQQLAQAANASKGEGWFDDDGDFFNKENT
ncbi:hypothetical protein F4818DRAFT_442887 [Hypoxylon cercidicola]|nr:hypothetical protein F4818DRAFT_442887 [Hypoxylon cercidicola]